ncbi:MAG: glycosyl transferase [Acaryochloridaceae cyanobacterium CSU_3_4]|nr:glycosyl transferase [Acaryochloridaceae cyanobacterium CSU_3_4]
MKKILFYCQYHLGMGHLVRSLEIIRSLATEFQICFVKGGTTVTGLTLPGNVEVVTLPMILSENRQVRVPDPSQDLETVKQQRTAKLLEVFDRFQPDCLMIEGYPFKKYQFEFESIPLLERVKASRKPIKVVCSLRDVVMAQPYTDRHGIIAKTCQRLNHYFDLLLVHSDPRFHRLEESFPAIADIHCPVEYTGFVAQALSADAIWTEEDVADLSQGNPMILVSVGGGQLGHDLLKATLAASPILKDLLPDHHVQVFTGPFIPPDLFQTLEQAAVEQKNLTLRKFTPNLILYMKKAALSVSLGGYNTTMNILRTGTNAIILPSSKDWEQSVRAEKLEKMGVLKLLQPKDLPPEGLAQRIAEVIAAPLSVKPFQPFELQGAKTTTALLRAVLEQPVAA